MSRVVLTDHPWADVDIERDLIGEAGHELIVGPVKAADSGTIEALVADTDPEAIMTCWAPVSERAIFLPSKLAIVARMGVGLDNIEVAAATSRGAWVTNVPDYCVSEVSDHAVALVLAALRGVVVLDRAVKELGWHVPAFHPPRLSDLTVGIFGYGRVGRATARKLHAFGCRVLAHDPSQTAAADGVTLAGRDELRTQADVIVLHMPLTTETAHFIDRGFVQGCAKRPLIVNASRGGLIDNDALIWGLDQGLLRGAALDVVDGEPAPPRAVLGRPDIVVTPHVAYLSDASLIDLRRRACEEVVRVLAGAQPVQPCNSPAVARQDRSLPGGVSSDIRVVHGPAGPEVVKTALAQLRVAADWRASQARSMVEARALVAAEDLLGAGAVPRLLWSRPEENRFAMTLVEPRYRNWKQVLMGGEVALPTARAAGRLLGRLHSRSAARPDLAREFDDRTYFHQLRVEPFFERVAAKLPALADEIRSTAETIWHTRNALVHGDFSPKNILADGDEIVLLDFEVAHWGDSRFDIGFCISHLLLKSLRQNVDRQKFLLAANSVLDGYAETGPPGSDDRGLARITACLMLARTDGPSPVDYLDAAAIDRARRIADKILRSAEPGMRDHIHRLGETP